MRKPIVDKPSKFWGTLLPVYALSTVMSVSELRDEIKNDKLVVSRSTELTVAGSELHIEEFGNPALTVDESGDQPKLAETGRRHLSEHIQDIARDVLGHGSYKVTVYEDDTKSEITVTVDV